MQCYTEITPPTAVTQAVNLPFLSAKANNVVVAKTTLLQVFETKSTAVSKSGQGRHVDQARKDTASVKQKTSLVLIAEYPLSGIVTSLARVKILDSKSGGEALLIAFKDAKLTLVEWDPEFHSISTISVHYYEGEELEECPWMPELGDTYNFLTADPNSRCAALKFGQRKLAILPFRQNEDDLMEDDYKSDDDEAMDQPVAKQGPTNGDGAEHTATQLPYKASFVLPLTALDPALTHPVHLAFLHEYREPTFGVIASSKEAAASLLAERKDALSYTVFTLDLEQRASTKLVSVSGLPYDLSRVVPLPLPVGGALLLGDNEIIHVDQSGKTHGVAVNDFARQASAFAMADQSDLGMRLEGCMIEHVSSETGDLVMILKTGELVTLSFRLDGRSVSGLTVQRVPEGRGGRLLGNAASCLINAGTNRLFAGSEEGDSVLIGWSRKPDEIQKPRKKSRAELLEIDPDLFLDEDDFDDDDDDDLYDDSGPKESKASNGAIEGDGVRDAIFSRHDILPNLGPFGDVTVAEASASANSSVADRKIQPTLELVAATGRGQDSALAFLSRDVQSVVRAEHSVSQIHSAWSVKLRKQSGEGQDTKAAKTISKPTQYHELLIGHKTGGADGDSAAVYKINGTTLEETTDGDFERDGITTVDIGTLHDEARLIQVAKSEVRSYDSELGLSQILPMEDEESGAELQVIGSSFADPYLLILRDDSSAVIFSADAQGELEEVERSENFQTSKWLSACLYREAEPSGETLGFFLTAEGSLRVFRLPDLSTPVFVAEGLGFLPTNITQEYIPRRAANKTIFTEILVADLGDASHQSPYLILRTSTDDLAIYEPYQYLASSRTLSLASNVRWRKISQPHLPTYEDDAVEEMSKASTSGTLRALRNVAGHYAVFQTGPSSRFVLREASGLPKVLRLKGKAAISISEYHTTECERGFATVDADGNLAVRQLLPETSYSELGWAMRKVTFSQKIDKVCYFSRKKLYVVATSEHEDFTLPDDSYHHEYAREDIKFKPLTERGYIKLLHPTNWNIVDTYELQSNEVTMSMEVLDLEVSENTHERKRLLVVGTATLKGEDLATQGCVYVFDVINVVPEPGRPETNSKLKLLVKEEVKGAVTAISKIGSQGFMLIAQGQKCMVRGLKEDCTLLPVAFMDMQTYVTALKCLDNTGLILMADAAQGVRLTGYTEEPYKMILLGKSRTELDVIGAEILPHDGNLYLIIADADCNLHILQYDPEHPKSLSGARLLHKSTFHTGHFTTTMTLLPSTIHPVNADTNDLDQDRMALDDSTPKILQQILVTSQNGALALLTPVTEPQYRRLGALQTYLTNILDHPCGLNPRAHRAIESEGYGSRGVLDGDILKRWNELSSQRKAEGLGKVGVEEWVVRGDLEFIGGGGLSYL